MFFKRDNREPFLTDESGQPVGLLVTDGSDNTHWLLHDADGHRMPVITRRRRWFLFFPYWEEEQIYPLTDNGHTSLDAIRQRVAAHSGAQVVQMPLDVQRRSERAEDWLR